MNSLRSRLIGVTAAVIALIAPLGLSACSSRDGGKTAESSTTAAAGGGCPTTPVNVVVSVDQWGDIVRDLGGECAQVTTVLASSSVDPHDFEPSPADAATFAKAQLVVVNGADYDPWASKLAATSAPKAPVVDAGVVTKTAAGANPHLWYSPSAVVAVADAVTAELAKLAPEAKGYFADQRTAFGTSLEPYNKLLSAIKAGATGKTYAATESVFDYTAEDVGLVNATPQGYKTASANESDPSPADLEAFRRALADRQINVLIYNTKTEGSVPEQIRTAAEAAGVPVVDVTETVPPGTTSFETWQVAQLTALAKALGVAV
ncbi:metal ABC transporter solute-binding protein, Zn/Mn family [Mycobacterium attenuatum]|uniref:metal ABC transporter solute-binding protein, Zn/Mn family n=1 Tax=Mycobacterium attenuatum TaxID=2341086 RepID=UPI000F0297CF|nr:zinc ABC transporter substrate-binding protein [Mycobacterium attenuatum]VBA45386.1 High-affinity zinc uptake system binding-protein ZnuA [Mycobacterium attenuatum]